jgi:hypothetical protein
MPDPSSPEATAIEVAYEDQVKALFKVLVANFGRGTCFPRGRSAVCRQVRGRSQACEAGKGISTQRRRTCPARKKNRSITKEEITCGSVSCSSTLAVPALASDGEGSSFTPSGRRTGLRHESLGLGTRKQGEAPCKPFLIEPQDVERAVIGPDLAVPVIGPEPLVEDFCDLDRALIETDSPWHGHALRFMCLDLDVHAFASIGIAH